MTDPAVWLNGSILVRSRARIDPASQGLLFGLGVYDTLRTLPGGRPLGLRAHCSRLAAGAARLGLSAPGETVIGGAIAALLAASGLDEARIRITLAAGGFPGMIPPPEAPEDCLITAQPLPPAKPAARVLTVPWCRNERSPLAGIKFTACAGSILAQRAALQAGADEALFGNTRGELCEGAFSNVFIVKNGTVLTPPVSSGCLPGITREVVLGLCAEHRIPCREEPLPAAGHSGSPDTMPDEVFLTSSLRGIQPVEQLDAALLPAPGPVTRRLAQLYAGWLETASR